MQHIQHVRDSSLYFLSLKIVNRVVWNLPVLGDPNPLMYLNTESRPGRYFWGGVRGWIKCGTGHGQGRRPFADFSLDQTVMACNVMACAMVVVSLAGVIPRTQLPSEVLRASLKALGDLSYLFPPPFLVISLVWGLHGKVVFPIPYHPNYLPSRSSLDPSPLSSSLLPPALCSLATWVGFLILSHSELPDSWVLLPPVTLPGSYSS